MARTTIFLFLYVDLSKSSFWVSLGRVGDHIFHFELRDILSNGLGAVGFVSSQSRRAIGFAKRLDQTGLHYVFKLWSFVLLTRGCSDS